jgi:hypothetical protein
MRKAALLVFIAACVPQAAAAKGGVKVLNSIPEAYWGTWAPGTAACTDGDQAAIVLSAKAYAGPLGKCVVASVSEIPSPKGPTYSARLRCADPAEAQKQKAANVIIPTRFPSAPDSTASAPTSVVQETRQLRSNEL